MFKMTCRSETSVETDLDQQEDLVSCGFNFVYFKPNIGILSQSIENLERI